MRVLFITGEFPPMQGGVGDCTHEIAKELVSRGVDIQVLTSTKARAESGILNSKFKIQTSIRKWDWSSLRVIARACRDFAPEVVHIQYQTGAFGMHPAINFFPRVLPWLRRGRIKVGVTFHDLRVPYLFPKAGPVREWVTRVLAQSCDAVIATNDEDYLKLETWNAKHLDLIPIGSNITTTPPGNYDRAAWRAQLGVDENATLLCYFGFLNESKGGETLMRALALIPNAKLLMIGGQTGASDPTNIAYLAKIKSLISELQLTQRVIWTDHVAPEIVTAHFTASDICVMPYRDGASYRRGTLMAALAHGCAIVTTMTTDRRPMTDAQNVAVGGRQLAVKLPALIDGTNCLLIPPDDSQAIADAVRKLVVTPELRAKIGAGARALAQHFTWNKIAQQHLALYRQIANSE